MLTVNNVLLNFDITAPEDLLRYNSALVKMQNAKQTTFDTAQGESDVLKYAEFLKVQCKVVTDFIDEVFGDGTCNELLCEKVSLSQLMDVCNEISLAIKGQTQSVQKKLAKYEPNRKTQSVQPDNS